MTDLYRYIFAAVVVSACATVARPSEEPPAPEAPYEWRLPAGFPAPWVPPDNPMSEAKVALGRRLFYDSRLSGNGHFSCASCHRQELAFTDGRARSQGSTGELHPRSAMTLTNVAYNTTYNWADPGMRRLEEQALNPMFNREPIELGLFGRERELIDRLAADSELVAMFSSAFPERGVSIETIAQALAAFERTLISGDSPYDRYVFWGEPLTEPVARGLKLFFSENTRCSECHAGLNFSGPARVASKPDFVPEPEFHNTGLFDLDGHGAFPEPNRGVFEVSGRPDDMGAFRAPTLRNVQVTAPYMHDGSLATLGEVIDFYAAGGRGAGRSSPLKSELLSGFVLTAQERGDLVAFLESLTDREFLGDPRFSDPADQKRQLTPAE